MLEPKTMSPIAWPCRPYESICRTKCHEETDDSNNIVSSRCGTFIRTALSDYDEFIQKRNDMTSNNLDHAGGGTSRHEEWLIDEAIRGSFPASDPASSSAPGSIVNRRYAEASAGSPRSSMPFVAALIA